MIYVPLPHAVCGMPAGTLVKWVQAIDLRSKTKKEQTLTLGQRCTIKWHSEKKHKKCIWGAPERVIVANQDFDNRLPVVMLEAELEGTQIILVPTEDIFPAHTRKSDTDQWEGGLYWFAHIHMENHLFAYELLPK